MLARAITASKSPQALTVTPRQRPRSSAQAPAHPRDKEIAISLVLYADRAGLIPRLIWQNRGSYAINSLVAKCGRVRSSEDKSIRRCFCVAATHFALQHRLGEGVRPALPALLFLPATRGLVA